MTAITAKRDPIHITAHPDIERQIQGIIQALVKRLQLAGAVFDWHGWTARDLSIALAGGSVAADPRTMIGPSAAAAIVLDGLLDPDDIQDPKFWATPLGRALAFWGTGDPSSVTRSCAAAALNMTRQNVLLMLRDGRLSEPANAGTSDLVSTASLAHAMRQRYPLGG